MLSILLLYVKPCRISVVIVAAILKSTAILENDICIKLNLHRIERGPGEKYCKYLQQHYNDFPDVLVITNAMQYSDGFTQLFA